MSTEIQRISEAYDVSPENKALLEVLRKKHKLAARIEAALTELNRSTKGATVLDIGCGNTDDRQKRNFDYHPEPPRRFEPWLARMLASRGAHVTGLDHSKEAPLVETADGGSWTYIPHNFGIQEQIPDLDWLEAPSLPTGENVDVAAIVNVFHTRKLGEGTTGPWNNHLINWQTNMRYNFTRTAMIEQAMNCVGPNGLLLLNDLLFRRDPESGLFTPADQFTQKATKKDTNLQKLPFESRAVRKEINKVTRCPTNTDGDGSDSD